MLEDRHIFLGTVPAAERVDFLTAPHRPWLVENVSWTEAEHRIASEPPIAPALEVANDAACLLVERRTWRGTATVTIVKQNFRGDAFDLIARFGSNSER